MGNKKEKAKRLAEYLDHKCIEYDLNHLKEYSQLNIVNSCGEVIVRIYESKIVFEEHLKDGSIGREKYYGSLSNQNLHEIVWSL